MNKQKLTKKEIIDTIKDRANDYWHEIIRLCYKGNDVACLRVPAKRDSESWQEYMEQFEVELANRNKRNGEYILIIQLRDYASYVSFLIDEIRGI